MYKHITITKTQFCHESICFFCLIFTYTKVSNTGSLEPLVSTDRDLWHQHDLLQFVNFVFIALQLRKRFGYTTTFLFPGPLVGLVASKCVPVMQPYMPSFPPRSKLVNIGAINSQCYWYWQMFTIWTFVILTHVCLQYCRGQSEQFW